MRQSLELVNQQLLSARGGPLWCREYYLAQRMVEEAIKQLDARDERRRNIPHDHPEGYGGPAGCNGCGG